MQEFRSVGLPVCLSCTPARRMHVATYTRTFYVRKRFNDGPGTAGEWG